MGPEGCVTLKEAKENPTPGTKFYVSQTGSFGVILESKSSHGKIQARMTCTKGGPDHIREMSDWHQCGVSPEMKNVKKEKKEKVSKVSFSVDDKMILENRLNERLHKLNNVDAGTLVACIDGEDMEYYDEIPESEAPNNKRHVVMRAQVLPLCENKYKYWIITNDGVCVTRAYMCLDKALNELYENFSK